MNTWAGAYEARIANLENELAAEREVTSREWAQRDEALRRISELESKLDQIRRYCLEELGNPEYIEQLHKVLELAGHERVPGRVAIINPDAKVRIIEEPE